MNKQLGAVVAFLLAATTAVAQDMTQVFTRPAVPPTEALDRLNLKVGWRTYIPTDTTRDGIATFQIADRQIFVQTRSGLIAALDRDTGQTLWRTRVGKPYESFQPLGWNRKAVFAAHGTWLYALDRNTGQLQWQFPMIDAVASGVAADELQIYAAFGSGRITIHELPEVSRGAVTLTGIAANKNYLPKSDAPPPPIPAFYGGSSGTTSGVGPLSSAIQAMRTEVLGPKPLHRQDYRLPGAEFAPLLTPYEMVWATSDGTVSVFPKATEIPVRPYRFPTDGRISAQPGQHGEVAYIVSHDGNVYALHITTGRTLWRFAGGNPIAQKPAVTNDDVYVVPTGSGLHRLDRVSGQTVWRNLTAQRFLSANPKFVYAADRSGRLMVLDRARGTQLSIYDGTREFVVPLSNDITDRIFLAAHDGSLVCLHDRDYGTPVAMKDDDEKLFPQPKKPGVANPLEGKPPDKMPEKPGEKMPEKPNGKMPEKPEGKMPEKP